MQGGWYLGSGSKVQVCLQDGLEPELDYDYTFTTFTC